MRTGLVAALAASLLAGACNMADGQREREGARAERGKQRESAERRTDKGEPRQPVRKLEEADGAAEAQLASSPASAPAAGGLTRAWFAGRWTDTGDCAQAGQFSADGTFSLADGKRGMWNIRDGKLVVQQGGGGRSEVQLRRIDDDTVEVVGSDGSGGRSIRC
jgi:hypothetical protein